MTPRLTPTATTTLERARDVPLLAPWTAPTLRPLDVLDTDKTASTSEFTSFGPVS